MKLSVIVPALDEAKFIHKLIESIEDVDETEKEILIVDGGSNDGTVEAVRELSKCYSNIKLVQNPERYVSHGFNRAFLQAEGEFIALVGAHAIYPKNYFKECIKVIEEGECNASGGFLIQEGKSNKGKAIASAMSSKFGVGNTDFRTKPRRSYVESVAFAVYDKRIFKKVGLFDELLIRNQDDEFHYRINAAGFRILMLPELKVTYFVRESFKKLFVQYYNYGLFKPLVFKKVRSGMRLRHLIPSFFVVYIVSLPLILFSILWLLPLLIYTTFSIYFSLNSKNRVRAKLLTPIVFPILHLSYGLGFLNGLLKWRKYKS